MASFSTQLNASTESPSDFLSFLQGKFFDEEAHNFFTSFALTLQGKNDDFCTDLDEAYGWLGYTREDNAVKLLKRLNMKKDVDLLLRQLAEHRKPNK